MLDVSLRMGILNLLEKKKRQGGLALVFITHDLASARYLADRILVLYAGQVMESAPSDVLVAAPRHPYTRLLLSAVSGGHARLATPIGAAPGRPQLVDPQSGCVHSATLPAGRRRLSPRRPARRPARRQSSRALPPRGRAPSHRAARARKPTLKRNFLLLSTSPSASPRRATRSRAPSARTAAASPSGDRFAATPGKIADGSATASPAWVITTIASRTTSGSCASSACRATARWPGRAMPDGDGAVNLAGLDSTIAVDALLEAGIAPALTLYHWDLPQALEDQVPALARHRLGLRALRRDRRALPRRPHKR
ncbi:MAG: family 1 glycosylhydrolase [Myxococcota bacterium]